jgi:acetyl-CoA acetyltransferase
MAERVSLAQGIAAIVRDGDSVALEGFTHLKRRPELNPEIVNANGGAIAIDHALRASGARILAGLAYELKRRGGGYALAAICSGVGQGLAVALEAGGWV